MRRELGGIRQSIRWAARQQLGSVIALLTNQIDPLYSTTVHNQQTPLLRAYSVTHPRIDGEHLLQSTDRFEGFMTIQTTYTQARANLAKLCNRVSANREVVIIQRRGVEDVALIAADELISLMETAYLLRSPKNAERLLTALTRAQSRIIAPQSVEELRREVGLDESTPETDC